MRTVLAVDEMLGFAAQKRLKADGARVEVFTRQQMRDGGDDVVQVAALLGECVLVIGAAMWNPMSLLRRWRLPPSVAVVALVPKVTEGVERDARRLHFVAVVPGNLPEAIEAISSACDLAWFDRDSALLPIVIRSSSSVRERGRQRG